LFKLVNLIVSILYKYVSILYKFVIILYTFVSILYTLYGGYQKSTSLQCPKSAYTTYLNILFMHI